MDRAEGRGAHPRSLCFPRRRAEGTGRHQHDTTYDPRVRPWYRAAEQARTTIISDPDVFASETLIGVTVAAPFYADGKLAGVAAADITLSSLGAYLAERKMSPGTLSYILDHQGRVDRGLRPLQHLDHRAGQRRASAHQLARQSAAGHGVQRASPAGPGHVLLQRPRHGVCREPFAHGGRVRQDMAGFFTITPLSDFTGPFQANNDRLVIFGLLVVAVQVVIIYFFTGVISAPLGEARLRVQQDPGARRRQLPSVSSPIRESWCCRRPSTRWTSP